MKVCTNDLFGHSRYRDVLFESQRFRFCNAEMIRETEVLNVPVFSQLGFNKRFSHMVRRWIKEQMPA